MSLAVLTVMGVRVDTAEAVSCPPGLSGQTIVSIQVTGGTCDITDTSVEGNVEIKSGVVNIRDSYIAGNVISTGGAVRLLGGVTVKGNLQITGAQEGSGFVGDNNRIEGVVQYQGNAGYFTAHNGTIGGGIRIENNTGGASVVGNAVQAGGLVCRGNDPPPTGFDNKITGEKVDQCSGRMKGKLAASPQVRNGKLSLEPER
jgi:hypothetical protein